MLSGFSDEELFQAAVIEPRRAHVPLPDLQVIERQGWLQIVMPSFTQGGLNEVAHAVLDEESADAVIAETIASYRSLGCKFRWIVGPDSAPADLGARLARAGLVRHTGAAMALATTTALPTLDLSVERVTDRSLDAFTAVMAAGWNVPASSLSVANAAALRSTTHLMYLASIDGAPVAAASAVMFRRSMYLLGAVVLPAFRGRGLYRALVAARLADARAAGKVLATSHANGATSAPILARLGFVTVCELEVFFS